MPGLEKDQLEALRRQVEEDFRLDLAAIERIQHRFLVALSNTPASNYSSPANGSNGYGSNGHASNGHSSNGNASNGDAHATMSALPVMAEAAQEDVLVGSLRSMFSTSRK